VKTCQQCGKEVPADYWLPCCPAPSDCYHRHVRGLPPKVLVESVKPLVPVNPEPPGEHRPAGEEPKEPRKIRIPRRRGKNLRPGDTEALARHIAHWLNDRGATYRPVTVSKLYQGLNLYRYSEWRVALKSLQQRKVIKIEGSALTLEDPAWLLHEDLKVSRREKKAKRRRRHKRTPWFEAHLPQFLERDGLLPEAGDAQLELGVPEKEPYRGYFFPVPADDQESPTDDRQGSPEGAEDNEQDSSWRW
jgi:hypothetical protein